MRPLPTERVEQKKRAREALEWFIEHRANTSHDTTALTRWDAWCTNPLNRAAYAEISQLHQDASSLPAPSLPSREELMQELADDPEVTCASTSFVPALRRSRVPLRLSMCILFIVSVMLTSVFVVSRSPGSKVEPLEQSFASGPGEERTFALSDGSQITLGGDSHVVVRFTSEARQITLTHGEAAFQVAHNARRPFIVHAGGATTTAIGTAFQVRLYAQHAQVWVREGTVEVAPLKEVTIDDPGFTENTRWIPVRLTRGEEMSYDAQGGATAPKAADPRVAMAWTQGSLVPLIYHGRLLTEVIEDVQRYSHRKILLDPAVADLRFSGIVMQANIEGWIRDLPAIYPIDVIDCHLTPSRIPECFDPARILLRARWAQPIGIKSALR